MQEENQIIPQNEEGIATLITFLEITKDGKYAEIDTSSLEYSRLASDQDIIEQDECDYYYSLS